jgi:urease accessory protein
MVTTTGPPRHRGLLYSLGFVLATGLLHLLGITTGAIHRWSRLAGTAVSLAGVFFVWSAA